VLQVLNGQYMGTRYIEVFQQPPSDPGSVMQPGANLAATNLAAAAAVAASPIGSLNIGSMAPSAAERPRQEQALRHILPAVAESPRRELPNPLQAEMGTTPDTAGDTGGSGGCFQNPYGWDRRWWDAAQAPAGMQGLNGGGNKAWVNSANPPGILTAAAAAAAAAAGLPPPGTGHPAGLPGGKDNSWDTLFSFLKSPGEPPLPPSVAALDGRGAGRVPGAAGHVGLAPS